jgi:sulfotransferase family protein
MESTRAPLIRWAAGTRRRHQVVGAVFRSAAPLLPRKPAPRRPVFILGSPRSGTTMLFNLVDRSPRMKSLGTGSQFVWDMFHKIQASDRSDHAVGPEDITDRERKVLYWLIDRVAGGERYMDKFPRNCLRGKYLDRLFPDASFIYIRRDGRSVVSSLITGWKTEGKFGFGIPLPEPISVEGYAGDQWRFLVPPGWREYANGHTLAEVCAFQWVGANEAVLSAKAAIAPERWVDVSYEELLVSPVETTARLFEGIGLPADDEVLTWASELDTHVSRTAVSAPSREKWRQEHPDEVESILPMIAPMMRRLGYEM